MQIYMSQLFLTGSLFWFKFLISTRDGCRELFYFLFQTKSFFSNLGNNRTWGRWVSGRVTWYFNIQSIIQIPNWINSCCLKHDNGPSLILDFNDELTFLNSWSLSSINACNSSWTCFYGIYTIYNDAFFICMKLFSVASKCMQKV